MRINDHELHALDLWSLATEGTQEFHELLRAAKISVISEIRGLKKNYSKKIKVYETVS